MGSFVPQMQRNTPQAPAMNPFLAALFSSQLPQILQGMQQGMPQQNGIDPNISFNPQPGGASTMYGDGTWRPGGFDMGTMTQIQNAMMMGSPTAQIQNPPAVPQAMINPTSPEIQNLMGGGQGAQGMPDFTQPHPLQAGILQSNPAKTMMTQPQPYEKANTMMTTVPKRNSFGAL
jgi:hypothetical protein